MTATAYDPTKRSIAERIFHAITFEVVATVFCAPVLSWVLNKSLVQTISLTVMFAAVAMVWNMIFNAIFDRGLRRWGLRKTPTVRIIHASLFEIGLIVVLVPLAAWWMSISLLQAFFLDIGMILFFLPYTFFFNLAYDWIREKRMAGAAEVAEEKPLEAQHANG